MNAPLARVVPCDFESLYRDWFVPVTHWLERFGVARADVEDVAQEVFLVARQQLDRFDGVAPGGWLHEIARRVASNHRRLAWVRRVEASDELPMSIAASDPERDLDRREQGAWASSLLECLTPEQRRAFVRFELEGWSGEEIASDERVPAATIFSRLHGARKKLAARTTGLRLVVALVAALILAAASAMAWRYTHPSTTSRSTAPVRTTPSRSFFRMRPHFAEPQQPPPPTRRPRRAHHAATLPATSSASSSPSSAGSASAEESALLLAAYGALHRADRSTALDEVDEYLSRFPHGVLREEALELATSARALPRK